MVLELKSLILDVENILDNKDHIDVKKIEQEFSNSLDTVFAEITNVELRTSDEISKMSNEEFADELKILEYKYDQEIQKLLKKQLANQNILKARKKESLESRIQSLKLTLTKLDPKSILYASYQSSLDSAKTDLADLEEVV
jgi:hypothetical protein